MLEFHTLDVFTDAPYTGNPLAVVLGADRLTPAQMQTVAREFNLSETIFVMAPRDPAHSARVRIFLPMAEIPFAGHPTLGCAVLLAEMAKGTGDWDTTLTLEEEAGLVPVILSRRGGSTQGRFAAPMIPGRVAGNPDKGLIAKALGLSPDQIGRAGHAPGFYQGGPTFLIVPLADTSALAKASPQMAHWDGLMQAGRVLGAYLHAPGAANNLEARMFAPTAGIFEDPATGAATAILAAQLRDAGLLADGDTTFSLRQGAQMGRPSLLSLRVTARAGAITRVEVGGSAVRISEGRLTPPS